MCLFCCLFFCYRGLVQLRSFKSCSSFFYTGFYLQLPERWSPHRCSTSNSKFFSSVQNLLLFKIPNEGNSNYCLALSQIYNTIPRLLFAIPLFVSAFCPANFMTHKPEDQKEINFHLPH